MERNWSGDMNYKELMAADIPIASAIISYGEDWKIERVNKEFVKLSGYTERDLGESGRDQLITEEDCYLFEDTLAQAIATKIILMQCRTFLLFSGILIIRSEKRSARRFLKKNMR